MSWEVTAVALTAIGLLGSLAVTMIALFFRVGAFKGSTEVRMDTFAADQAKLADQNSHEHMMIYEKLNDNHGRLMRLEERTGDRGPRGRRGEQGEPGEQGPRGYGMEEVPHRRTRQEREGSE